MENKIHTPTLEKITWRDIAGITEEKNSRWMEKDEVIEEARRLFEAEYTTVGYVLYEDDDFIAVAATKDGEEDPSYHDASMIPKSVIVRREVIDTTDKEVHVAAKKVKESSINPAERATVMKPKKKSAKICKNCGEPGHMQKTCQKNKLGLDVETFVPDISSSREEGLVVDIRSMWIVDGMNTFDVIKSLGIKKELFDYIVKKYSMSR